MKPGLYSDIPFERYRSIDAVNASLLKDFSRSPAHALYSKNNDSDNASLFIGRAVHCAVLEPERFKEEYLVADCQLKTAQAYKTAVKDNPTKTVITKNDFETISGIANSVKQPSHSQAYGLLCADSYNEITAVWVDEETGLKCKARADRYILDQDGNPVIVDLKTTVDASVQSFSRAIATYNYHLAASFYLDGFAQLTKRAHTRFIIIAAEKEAPFEVSVFEIEPFAIDAGRLKYRKYLSQYKQASENKVWAGYANEIVPLGIPSWAHE